MKHFGLFFLIFIFWNSAANAISLSDVITSQPGKINLSTTTVLSKNDDFHYIFENKDFFDDFTTKMLKENDTNSFHLIVSGAYENKPNFGVIHDKMLVGVGFSIPLFLPK